MYPATRAMLCCAGALLAPAALISRALGAQGQPVLARPVPAADSVAAAEVLRRTRVWHDAIMRADTAALRRILLPEFSLTIPPDVERVHVPLEQYLQSTVGYHLAADRWEASDVRILGDVAVVTSRFWQQATPNGRDRSGYFVLTDVWRKLGGEWRVATRWSTWLDMPGGVSPAARKPPAP